MLTLKDPVNNTTTWQYDTLGRVTQKGRKGVRTH